MAQQDARAIAAQLLRVPGETLEAKPMPEVHAVYVWQPVRGGAALLVSTGDGSVLSASSDVPLDEHVAAFSAGRRTDRSAFA